MTLALIERIAPTIERLAAHGFDVTATTLQASRLKPLAGGHRLAAENPVTVIMGRRPDEAGSCAGVGCSLGCPPEELRALIEATLAAGRELVALATVDRRAEEPCIVAAAAALGVPLLTYSADELAAVPVPTPSAVGRAPRRHAERRRGRRAAVRHAADRPQAPFGACNLRGGRMARVIHPIEVESYRILRSRIDLSHLPPLSRAVAERVIHAAADLSFADSLILDEAALTRGREALLERRARVLRRAHGRRRHHVAAADRPARRRPRQPAARA